MKNGQVVTIEDRIPKLKEKRRRKANRRFIFYIILFFLMLLIIIYLQSSISHVGSIRVEGNRYVDSKEIIEMSGISDRTSFWKVKTKTAEQKVGKHKEIKSAMIDKELPNKIIIQVKEYDRDAYLSKEGKFYPVLETGKLISPVEGGELPADAPLLYGFHNNEDLQELAAELSKIQESIKNRISEIHLTPEESDPLHLTLFMTDGREVSATIRGFAKKMDAYPAIVKELPADQKGVIHLEVGTYFEAYESPGDEGEKTDETEQ